MKRILLSIIIAAAVLSGCTQKKVSLFNGSDLTGWVCFLDSSGDARISDVFGVRDGNILIKGAPFGYMRTAEKYGDYKLHVEWRWVGEGTNSGIFQRVQDGDRLWPTGIECQLCHGKAGDFVMLGGSKISEIECVGQFPVKERNGNFENPAGEWNTADIVCEGRTITVYINGNLQNQCTGDAEDGYIALQSEGGPIEFRNIYITE